MYKAEIKRGKKTQEIMNMGVYFKGMTLEIIFSISNILPIKKKHTKASAWCYDLQKFIDQGKVSYKVHEKQLANQ